MNDEKSDWKDRTIVSYDENAERLAKKYDGLGARRKDLKRVIELTHTDNPSVVELGSGNGRDAQVFMEYTDDYVGVDASERLVNMARANVPDAKFVVEDIEDYSFPQGVDCLVAFASLLHLIRDAVRNVLRRAHHG